MKIKPDKKFGIKQFIVVILSVLFILMIVTLKLEIDRAEERYQSLAVNVGKYYFKAVVGIRAWNAEHNGVYVPVTEELQPNPYLDDPLRDVETLEGMELTKVNPAYMTRLVSGIIREYDGIGFHITSLNPVNPSNATDSWEKESLEAFEEGETNKWTLSDTDGNKYLRYMEPLYVEESCLQCHSGYNTGDIRGGISVQVPYSSFEDAKNAAILRIVLVYFIFFVVFGSVTVFFGRKTIANEKTLQSYNHTLEDISRTDELTGLFNRRYLMNQLEEEIKRSIKYEYPLSVMVLDLDNFKNINDTYGHLAGDKVLQQAAKLMVSAVRSDDIVGRYGGDEFIIILPKTAVNVGKEIAERIINAFRNEEIIIDENLKLSILASVGISALSHGDTDKKGLGDWLLSKADKALYEAKEKGKDSIQISEN